MYKWAGKQVHEPLPPLNGHYSIHSVNVSKPAEFNWGKTEAPGVKTTADPRGTARTHWAARGKPSYALDRRNPPTLPSAELPATEEIRRTEENLEDHDYIGRKTVKAPGAYHYGRDQQTRHYELKSGVQPQSNFLHVQIISDQCGTKIKFD